MKKILVVCCGLLQVACVLHVYDPWAKYCIRGFCCFEQLPLIVEKNDDGAELCLKRIPSSYYDFGLFDAISEEFGNIDFEDITGRLGPNHAYDSLYPYPSAVEITSDKDWDDAHPVGSPLGDCFEISYYSIADYVDHRYDEAFSYTISEQHVKLLSELAPDDLRMVLLTEDDFMRLTPVVRPQSGSVHRLTVVWTMHDGTECVSEVEVEF